MNHSTEPKTIMNLLARLKVKNRWQEHHTDAIIISFPAPAEPPITATIRLGTMAKLRVKRFRIHGFNRKSRNP